jgi:hypothetical protein
MTEGQTQGDWGDIEGGIDWPGKAKIVEEAKNPGVEPEVVGDTEDLELTWDHTREKEIPQDMSPAEAAKWDAERERLYNEKNSGELPN